MLNIDFDKADGLVPAVIQDYVTMQVLMVGYMNEEALRKTSEEGRVTFFSRSRKKLWTKGETSGNYLVVKEIIADCDQDTLLIKVMPAGPVCHSGSSTCFGDRQIKGFIYKLEQIIDQRISANASNSYTNKLFSKGINKIAQKVGEEALEVIIEAIDNNNELLINETADLLYHLLILLKFRDIRIENIESCLLDRNKF